MEGEQLAVEGPEHKFELIFMKDTFEPPDFWFETIKRMKNFSGQEKTLAVKKVTVVSFLRVAFF